jgi:hypothetical protein
MKKGDCSYRNIHLPTMNRISEKYYFCRRFNNNGIMIMTHSMIVWSGIIVVIVFAFILRVLKELEKCHHAKDFRERHIHLKEMSKEEEMFFCPGDESMEVKDDSES